MTRLCAAALAVACLLLSVAIKVGAQQRTEPAWDTTKARGQTRDIDFDTSEGTLICCTRSRCSWTAKPASSTRRPTCRCTATSKDIHNNANIAMVMKAGTLYAADTLDEIWPEKKPFGAYYWINLDQLRNDMRPVDIYDRQ